MKKADSRFSVDAIKKASDAASKRCEQLMKNTSTKRNPKVDRELRRAKCKILAIKIDYDKYATKIHTRAKKYLRKHQNTDRVSVLLAKTADANRGRRVYLKLVIHRNKRKVDARVGTRSKFFFIPRPLNRKDERVLANLAL